ncbi:hypothetical protein CRUP_005451 [Coryphaenoides rupestris]|nr:hypothetical protein CRUP_005451 [Coryphaenoides rupestris]
MTRPACRPYRPATWPGSHTRAPSGTRRGWRRRRSCGCRLYSSAERVKAVAQVALPSGGNPSQWLQTGAALFLKQQ